MSESQRYESGLVVENRGHVRVLTLDRPERRNALSSELQADLVDQLLDAGEGGEVRALVLTSPERHGGHAREWRRVAEDLTGRGLPVLVIGGAAVRESIPSSPENDPIRDLA